MRIITLFLLIFLAASAAAAQTGTPQRLSRESDRPKVTKQVTPEYPADAKEARIQGSVCLEAVLAKDGHVKSVKVISGHRMLLDAAIDAVRQWEYEKTYLNGEPVEVITTVTANFKLNDDPSK